MQDLLFATGSVPATPSHNRWPAITTVFMHLILLLLLISVKTQPVRVSQAGEVHTGIAAYIAGPVGTAPASEAKPASLPKKTTIARTAKTEPPEDQSDAAPTGGAPTIGAQAGGQAGGAPVRLGTGGSLTILNKVTPVYPAIMQSARVAGQVMLDAIIHHDGTIGDVTVLRSTNAVFAQSAIAAVKQWRYSPIPYEGIVTVTVNFTLQ